jgi:uncharacterized protein
LRNSRQWSKKAFTVEMVDKAYEALFKIGGDKKLHSSLITLYGGEPLLAQNKDVVKYIVDKGKNLGYNFMAITNGYDLDSFKDILGPDKIRSLQITIDGMKDNHDKRRVHYMEKQSFDKIVANVGIALEQGALVNIRTNTDANNFDELNQIDQVFKDLNYYKKSGKLEINSALLFDYKDGQSFENKQLKFMDQLEFNKRHKAISFKYGCTISGVARILNRAYATKNKINFGSSYCSAQTGSYIFDPFGDIYSCWDDVGKIKKVIGHYGHGSVSWTEMKKLWHNQNISVSSDCMQCKYAFLCRGGCIAQRENRTGKFGPGFCNFFTNTFQDAVNMAYNNYRQI